MPVGSTYRLQQWPGETISFNDKLVVVTCPDCHITHAIPEEMDRRMHLYTKASYPNNTAFTYCPNGHQWHYTGKNEAHREREKREAVERDLALAEQEIRIARSQRDVERRKAAAAKGQITKIRKRIAAGICPACRANLGDRVRDHIKHAHPDFVAPEAE